MAKISIYFTKSMRENMRKMRKLFMLKGDLMKNWDSNEYYELLNGMSQYLYRQGMMFNMLEQLFIGMGFPDNEKVKDVKKIYG